MIEIVEGDILKADVEALVNTVNTKGVMGKGIALQFKRAFPEMYKAYALDCRNGLVNIGRMNIYDRNSMFKPRFIINFPTKEDWRRPSKLEYIQKGLDNLTVEIRARRISSIAIPPLGCGNGGLDWGIVKPIIEKAMSDLPEVNVQIYTPNDVSVSADSKSATKKPEMNLKRAMTIKLLDQYCGLGYELSLIEVQKLLYFLQESGEQLRLRFEKQYYGPYADNVRHILLNFEGHYTSGFDMGNNKPGTTIRLLDGASDEADRYITENMDEISESLERLSRVERLIEGFESPYGLELLATVHWLVIHENIPSQDHTEIMQNISRWNDRKAKLMKPEHVLTATKRMQADNWI